MNWSWPDWERMLVPETPILEVFLRGTIVYLVLFFALRFALKRQAGNISISDMLVIVLIADASQNAMAGEYHSIPDGLMLAATLIFWDFVLDWLGYRFPRLRLLTHPETVPLIRNGRVLRANLRRALLTEDDLRSKLREEGIEDAADVRLANMEGDGQISVIERKRHSAGRKPQHGTNNHRPKSRRDSRTSRRSR